MSVVIYETSAPIQVQHFSDTGFGSAEVGRAQVDLGGLRFRAKHPGTDANNVEVQLARSLRPGEAVKVFQDRWLLAVFYAPGATCAEVAANVNAARGALAVASALTPAAAAPSSVSADLAGGLDPVVVRGVHHKYAAPLGGEGGRFYFGQGRNQYVTQVEGTFALAAPREVRVEVLNLDEGLEPIPGEASTVYCTTVDPAEATFVVTDVRLQLLPGRAVRVACAAPGTVRVQVQQAAVQTGV